MKAEIKPRIELENRTKLETVIPIRVPFLVFVDPSDVCNFQCKFCPTGNREILKKTRPFSGNMDLDLFKKIVDDLCEFEHPIKVLRLYKDGEPLLNPKFPDMVRYAKKRNCALQVDTTTNGSLLTPEKNLQLIDAGLDRIHISLEGLTDEFYQKFAGVQIRFSKLVENIRHLYEHKKQCMVCVKVVGDYLSEQEIHLFQETFGDIADRIFVEHVAPCWPTFKQEEFPPNTKVGIYGQAIQSVEVCPYIFYSMSVNSDGTVSLCFLDWARKLIIGDVKNTHLKDIWNGEILYQYQRMNLLKKRKKHPFCGQCGQLTHCRPDDIDAYSEMLLGRLTHNE